MKPSEKGLWQNSGVRFNIDESFCEVTNGEYPTLVMNNVQVFKEGNCDLHLTNLRLMWKCHLKAGINICVGFSSVTNLESKIDPKMCLDVIWDRPIFDEEGTLRLLNNEELETVVPEAWLIQKEEDELGTVFITTCRFIWCCNGDLKNNFSIPFHRMYLADIVKGNHGSLFVIASMSENSTYAIVIKVFNEELQNEMFSQIWVSVTMALMAPICGKPFQIDGQTLTELENFDLALLRLKKAMENKDIPERSKKTQDSQKAVEAEISFDSETDDSQKPDQEAG